MQTSDRREPLNNNSQTAALEFWKMDKKVENDSRLKIADLSLKNEVLKLIDLISRSLRWPSGPVVD